MCGVWWCVVVFGCRVCVVAENLPSVDSSRLRVYIQDVPMCNGNTSTCIRHVDVLPVHTKAC